MQTDNRQAVLNKALEQIGDAFRPERKERQDVLSQGCRVQELVEAGRYSFAEISRKMKVDAKAVMEALDWLIDDNARMNVDYDTDVHCQRPYHYIMVGWFQEQEALQPKADVIQLMTAINHAQALQNGVAS